MMIFSSGFFLHLSTDEERTPPYTPARTKYETPSSPPSKSPWSPAPVVALVYEDQSTMSELGRPAAATARIGVETSLSDEAWTATETRRLVDVVVGDLVKAIFAFAARMRGDAADALLALRVGREALVIIDARAIVIVADIFSAWNAKRGGDRKKGERRNRR